MRKTDRDQPPGAKPSRLLIYATAFTLSWLIWLAAVMLVADATALWGYIVLLGVAWLLIATYIH